jgi:hypothetical protein
MRVALHVESGNDFIYYKLYAKVELVFATEREHPTSSKTSQAIIFAFFKNHSALALPWIRTGESAIGWLAHRVFAGTACWLQRTVTDLAWRVELPPIRIPNSPGSSA